MTSRTEQNLVEKIGATTIALLEYIGGMSILFVAAVKCILAGVLPGKGRLDTHEVLTQLMRIGVRSLAVVCLVQGFIGVILALQMEPPLSLFQQQARISSIIGIAGFRMLGPIITAIVLSGFAGASIAAEIGTMVVSEEVEAMEAMAFDPIRFLVAPRLAATIMAMLLLTPIADLMIALGGFIVSKLILGPEVYNQYWELMRGMLQVNDFYTGMTQSAAFGVLISSIACYEGLRVRGGAAGVGQATTSTVVKCIVAIILSSCIFTVIFFSQGAK